MKNTLHIGGGTIGHWEMGHEEKQGHYDAMEEIQRRLAEAEWSYQDVPSQTELPEVPKKKTAASMGQYSRMMVAFLLELARREDHYLQNQFDEIWIRVRNRKWLEEKIEALHQEFLDTYELQSDTIQAIREALIVDIWKTMQKIQPLSLPEPPEYQAARKSYRSFVDETIAKIASGDIVSD